MIVKSLVKQRTNLAVLNRLHGKAKLQQEAVLDSTVTMVAAEVDAVEDVEVEAVEATAEDTEETHEIESGGPGSGRKPSGFTSDEHKARFNNGVKQWIDEDERGLHKDANHPQMEHVIGNALGLHGFALWRRSDSGGTSFFSHPEKGEIALDHKNRSFTHSTDEGVQKEGHIRELPGYVAGL
jgi:hypothetical protein